MNEKTQMMQEIQQEEPDFQDIIIDIDPTSSSLASPPCYEATTSDAPPPPSYRQSTARLHYKNQPYISDADQVMYNLQESCSDALESDEDDTDNWSDIVKLPFRQRVKYYYRSWVTTIYDARFIFFAFFVLLAIIVLGLVVSFLVIPSLFKHY